MVVPTTTERSSSVKSTIGEFTIFPAEGAGVDVGGTDVGVGGTGVGGTGGVGVGVVGTGIGVRNAGGTGTGGIGAGVGVLGASPVTVMVAVMKGCIVHQYGNSPGSSKVKLKASPVSKAPLSQIPSLFGETPDVEV